MPPVNTTTEKSASRKEFWKGNIFLDSRLLQFENCFSSLQGKLLPITGGKRTGESKINQARAQASELAPRPGPVAEKGELIYSPDSSGFLLDKLANLSGAWNLPNLSGAWDKVYRALGWDKKIVNDNENGNEAYYLSLRKKLLEDRNGRIETWGAVTGDYLRSQYANDPEIEDGRSSRLNEAMSVDRKHWEDRVNDQVLVDADPWTIDGVAEPGLMRYQTNAIIGLDSIDRLYGHLKNRAGKFTDVVINTHGSDMIFTLVRDAGAYDVNDDLILNRADFIRLVSLIPEGGALTLTGCKIAESPESRDILQKFADKFGIRVVAYQNKSTGGEELPGSPIEFLPNPNAGCVNISPSPSPFGNIDLGGLNCVR